MMCANMSDTLIIAEITLDKTLLMVTNNDNM